MTVAAGSSPDPYVITELGADATILPTYSSIDGLTQKDPRLIAETTAVIVVGGQSLVGNYSQTSFTPVNAKVQVLNILNGGVYQVGSTPLPGSGGILDNYAKRIADKMITAGKYARIILVPIAMSSSSFAQWAVGGNLNSRIGVAGKRLAAVGLTATHVIWGQGETDNVNATSQASCTTSLNSIIASLQAAFGGSVPIYIAQESYYLGATAANVTNAQAAVVTGTVHAGINSDSIGAASRYDNIHFNATGADSAAALWATLLP